MEDSNQSELKTDRERLKEGFEKLLRQADEKKARTIIAETLGQPSGTQGHETLLQHWRNCRTEHGWQVS